MYQATAASTGNPYNKYMKRSSTDRGNKGPQNFELSGQTPQALVGHEANQGHPYAVGGAFPAPRHGGGFNNNRLQNAINSNRNRYFLNQYANEIPDSMSNRMLQGIQGGHFNGMDGTQQPHYSVNRLQYMGGNSRRVSQSFKSHFNQSIYGNTHPGLHNQYSFDSMLPNIPGHSDRYHEFDPADDLDEQEGDFRYKYNGKPQNAGDNYNAADLIGKYAKYYRASADLQGDQKKQIQAVVASSHDKNNELVSRYLKHAAKKQVRSTSISVPKYTGDYDPDVFITGKVPSQESMSESSLTNLKRGKLSQEEINKELLLNKQEAAAEQRFRLEKSNFPSPASINTASTENKSDTAKYKLKYTKRKKMVIASTSDKENDPSMLVKGGDDVTTGNDSDDSDGDVSVKTPEKKDEIIKPIPIVEEKAAIVDYVEPAPVKVPSAKKIVKKMRRASVSKAVPEKEPEKKVEVSNKQQPEQTKPKVVKTVDIKKQVKKVTIEKVKRAPPVVATKAEEEKMEEVTEENLDLQPIVEEEDLSHLDHNSCHSDSSEELQFANDEDAEKLLEQQKAEDELNAILAPLRAQVPDHFRLSPTLGFLPIMPVTFSWFPMSQQHKEAFQKMSEQSKFPRSLRPFQRFAAT